MHSVVVARRLQDPGTSLFSKIVPLHQGFPLRNSLDYKNQPLAILRSLRQYQTKQILPQRNVTIEVSRFVPQS